MSQRMVSIRRHQLFGSCIVEKSIHSFQNLFLWWFISALFMCEQSQDQFWPTSISRLLLHVYLWNWCRNRCRRVRVRVCVPSAAIIASNSLWSLGRKQQRSVQTAQILSFLTVLWEQVVASPPQQDNGSTDKWWLIRDKVIHNETVEAFL